MRLKYERKNFHYSPFLANYHLAQVYFDHSCKLSFAKFIYKSNIGESRYLTSDLDLMS